MTAPSDPAPESSDTQQEIVLRLGDILPRVPAHLLKPGPHDTNAEIRFSVEELAEKIARGRVNVPLERFSSIYPHVFRHSSAFPGDQVVPLPLQKLLDQIGLMAPRASSANGIPAEHITRARASAGRLLQPEESEPATAKESPITASQQEPASPPRMARAITTARNLFGRLGLIADGPVQPAAQQPTAQPPAAQPPALQSPVGQEPEVRGPETQQAPQQLAALATKPLAEEPDQKNEGSNSQSQVAECGTAQAAEGDAPTPIVRATADKIAEPQPTPMLISPAPEQAAPQQPEATSIPGNAISLRALPIFRLLSPPVLKVADLPPDNVRIHLPLSAIDPQLEGGHVEIPVEDFVKALPPNLRGSIDPVPDTKIWIPLDEIFQNLPADHLYYMPPFDTAAAPEVTAPPAVEPEFALIKQGPAEHKPASESPPPVAEMKPETPPAAIETPAAKPADKAEITEENSVEPETIPEPAEPTAKTVESTGEIEAKEVNSPTPAAEISNAEKGEAPSQEKAPASQQSPTPVAKEEPRKETPVVADLKAEGRMAGLESNPNSKTDLVRVELPKPAPKVEAQPPQVAATADTQAPAKASLEIPAPAAPRATVPPPQPTSATQRPAEPPLPSRAPWMRGFQVPPPRLFGSTANAVPATPAPAPATPAEPPPTLAPATPEAKRTADFLASQPSIFAAAAFVDGSVYASENFPDQPDLQAIHEFITLFIDCMNECGQKLDWRQVITLPCGELHLTAVIRDTQIVAAIHHDRLLSPLAYDAVVEAADDLAKSAAPAAQKS